MPQEFGQVVQAHMHQWQTTDGADLLWWPIVPSIARPTSQKLAQTQMQWITRVPATLSEAQAALAQADPPGHGRASRGLSRITS